MQSLWMIVAGFFFALMAALIKVASQHHASLAAVIIARGLPSVLLIALWAVQQRRSLKPQWPQHHGLRSLFGVLAMWCAFYAYAHLPLATSASLNYSSPLFLAAWMAVVSADARHPMQLGAIALGFLGVLSILHPRIGDNEWQAALIGLFSAFCATLALLQVKILGRNNEPVWRIVFYFSLTVVSTGLCGLIVQGMGTPDSTALAALFGLGVAGMLGQLAMTRAFGYGATVLTAALQYTSVIFAALLGIVFWQNTPDTSAWLGMAMIIAAGTLCAWHTLPKK